MDRPVLAEDRHALGPHDTATLYTQLLAGQMESLDDMEKWAAVNGGVDAVRAGLAPGGVFNLEHQRLASVWLQRRNDDEAARRQATQLDLETRAVIANESAAAEAKRSADAAIDSARSARLAAWISLAALFVAAWPAFDLLRRLMR